MAEPSVTTLPDEEIDGGLTGTVFDIKRFAAGDGPGVRALIFLKGCPLRCIWCANPESHRPEPEVMYHRRKCVGCGKCIEVCPTHAIRADGEFGLVTDHDLCTACGQCVEACVYDAREMVGRAMSVLEVMRVIRRDRRFYDNSGGGVTIGGGEPLLQSEFTRELLRTCEVEGIHTALETCGFSEWGSLQSVLAHLDLLFYDVKHVDPERHRELTGRENESILGNLAKAAEEFAHGEIVVRVPLVPGRNDSKSALRGIFEFVARLPGIARVEILPYHRLGMMKYSGLGRTYALKGVDPVEKSELLHLADLSKDLGIDVRIDST